jgi:hypothetical protein
MCKIARVFFLSLPLKFGFILKSDGAITNHKWNSGQMLGDKKQSRAAQVFAVGCRCHQWDAHRLCGPGIDWWAHQNRAHSSSWFVGTQTQMQAVDPGSLNLL